jgi:hypothetical protein
MMMRQVSIYENVARRAPRQVTELMKIFKFLAQQRQSQSDAISVATPIAERCNIGSNVISHMDLNPGGM